MTGSQNHWKLLHSVTPTGEVAPPRGRAPHKELTQSRIALNSAEAEHFGGVKTACKTLGIASLLRDVGQKVKLRMIMYASAALGIAQRYGVGKVRYISSSILWL